MARKKKVKIKITAKLFIVLIVLLAIPVTLILISRPAILFPNAQNIQATISVTSASDKMPPNASASVMINSGNYKLGFAQVTILFDKDKVRLTDEITTTNLLKTVVSKTTMADANASGKIDIALGLSPQDSSNPPSGSFSFANFPMKSISSVENDLTVISVDQANSQLVDQTPQALVLAGQNLEFALNYVAPTATATATAQPTISPTSTPIGTSDSGIAGGPTSTPTETPTDRPTVVPGPTLPPEDSTDSTPSQNTNQVTWTIQSGQDIANEDNGWFYDSNKSLNMFIGSGSVPANSYLGLRFSGPTLVSGTDVKSAKIGLTASRDQWISLGFSAYVEKSTVPNPFTSTNRMSSRNMVTQSKSYADNVKWSANQTYYYDVTNQVKEAVTSAGVDLNSLAVVLQGEGSPYGRKNIIATGSSSPKLIIDYGEGNTTGGSGSTGGGSSTGGTPNIFSRLLEFFRSRFGRR